MDAALEQTIRERIAANLERTGPAPGAVAIPPIPAGRYTSTSFAQAEDERLWPTTWLFAGHASQLPDPGSYRSFERTGAPLVIVRGDDGELRAFYNSCRHRGAPVIRDECGTARRLTCQYHSWSYGTDGELKAVPDERNFVDLDSAGLGLVQVRLDTWQDFIFVTENDDAPPLAEHLGALADQMAEIDGTRLRFVGSQLHPIPANWKLLVDAFSEVYHIRTVHPDNAALLYDDRGVTVEMLPNGHSRLSVPIKPEMMGLVDPSPAGDNPSVGQLWRETSTSFGIFPNVIAPLDTGAFPLICAWPKGHRHTDLELVWLAPDWGDGDCPQEHLDRMMLFETVMAQDTANMSAMQVALESRGARDVQIGWHERLIHHFHRGVDLTIGADALPRDTAVSDALDRFVVEA